MTFLRDWTGSRNAQLILDRVVPITIFLLIAIQLLEANTLFARASWLSWADQSHYMQSARAWSVFNLDPSQHKYPAGYALMGAPFVGLLPNQPFLIPDLVCIAASLALFANVCQRLAPDMPHVRVVAAVSFLWATSGGSLQRQIWAEPWSTTAAAPFMLAMLLLTLKLADPESLRLARRYTFLLGLIAGLGMLIRPMDVALVALPCAFYVVYHHFKAPYSWLSLTMAILSGCGGFAVGILPFVVIHLAIYGTGPSPYLGYSASFGFEWRLIPLRWVMLVIGPRPLLPEGHGMQSAFIWIWPGIAGMILGVAGVGRRPWPNILIAAAVILSWSLYLAYRDLHPYGLWRFNNVHYFKWTLPFLAFWACDLIRRLIRPDARLAAAGALISAAFLFTWRPEFQPLSEGQISTKSVEQQQQVVIPADLAALDRAIMIQLDGNWRDIYYTKPNTLRIGDVAFPTVGDIKLFPGPGGAMLVPLRRLPPRNITLLLPAPVSFPAGARWQAGRQSMVFGMPCFVTPNRGICAPAKGASWLWLQKNR